MTAAFPLEKSSSASSQTAPPLLHPQPLIVKDIQEPVVQRRSTGAVCVRDKETYLFAVTPTAVATKVIPLGAQALSEKVSTFRRGLKALRQDTVGGKPAFWGSFSIIGEGAGEMTGRPRTRRGVNPHDEATGGHERRSRECPRRVWSTSGSGKIAAAQRTDVEGHGTNPLARERAARGAEQVARAAALTN